jgi:hypothetical protein
VADFSSKWLIFLLWGCAWGVACRWAALKGWSTALRCRALWTALSMSTAIPVIAIAGALPTLFWLEDGVRRRHDAAGTRLRQPGVVFRHLTHT